MDWGKVIESLLDLIKQGLSTFFGYEVGKKTTELKQRDAVDAAEKISRDISNDSSRLTSSQLDERLRKQDTE